MESADFPKSVNIKEDIDFNKILKLNCSVSVIMT